mgnify:CR=1 FL=1
MIENMQQLAKAMGCRATKDDVDARIALEKHCLKNSNGNATFFWCSYESMANLNTFYVEPEDSYDREGELRWPVNVKASGHAWSFPMCPEGLEVLKEMLLEAKDLEVCPPELRPLESQHILREKLKDSRERVGELLKTQSELIGTLRCALGDFEAMKEGRSFDEVCGIVPHLKTALRPFTKPTYRQKMLL